MPDELQNAFERLADRGVPPPPPPAFLHAVARRRSRRRAAQIAAALGILVLATIPLLLHGPAVAPVPDGRVELAESPGARGGSAAAVPTAHALLRLNPELDEQNLVLPAPPFGAAASASRAMVWNRQDLEQLLTN